MADAAHYSDEEDAYSDSHSSHGEEDMPRDSASPGDMGALGDKPRRKRTRTSRACDSCRKKRTKCTGEQPCSTCISFEVKKRGPVTKKDQFTTLESRIKTVESLLTNLLSNNGSPQVQANSPKPGLSGISAADAFDHSPTPQQQGPMYDPLEGVMMKDKDGGDFSIYFGGMSHAFANIWKRAPEYGYSALPRARPPHPPTAANAEDFVVVQSCKMGGMEAFPLYL
ncbi:hypothetical protein HK097_002003 [Rhizophlyctis rosea]|uniref:Zn(2)-C6 fungal-type domain-containing protein n=1 Tax=Rhizophlyctis rosea TaxID=64517 RepID=A0AAD5WYM6_9FUNG|nr:hypothetical protein HK097_002003 [Rhizophlyctis rosea]